MKSKDTKKTKSFFKIVLLSIFVLASIGFASGLTKFSSIKEFSKLVGPMFIPLMSGSFVGIAICIATRIRIIRAEGGDVFFSTLMQDQLKPTNSRREILQFCQSNQSRLSKFVSDTVNAMESVVNLEQYREVWRTSLIKHTTSLSSYAPVLRWITNSLLLLGLLGTLLAMVAGLQAIDGGEAISGLQRLLASLDEALWSTIMAIILVLPISLFQNLNLSRLEVFQRQLLEIGILLESIYSHQFSSGEPVPSPKRFDNCEPEEENQTEASAESETAIWEKAQEELIPKEAIPLVWFK